METRDILVPAERHKVCREMRSRQVENYKKFMALQEQQQPQPQRLLPRKPNKKGTTVHFHSSYILQSAIEEVEGKQVLSLLNTGADYNFKTGNGSSLLHKCCAEGNLAMAELLVLKGAEVNAADDDWWTPLHVACYQDNADIVQLLLTNEADVSLMDVDGNFPIDHAPQHTDSWETIISFMEAKGLTEKKLKKLRQLRGRQVEDEVRAIIQSSSDVSKAVTSDGVTFLHIACANGYTKCGQVLLKHGAQVNAVTTSGWTPLHCSAKFCQTKMVELLLKHGADTSCVNHEGNTAMDVAIGEEIQQLIRKATCAERKSAIGGGSMEETADGEDEYSGSVSRIMRPFRLPLSKADRLMEGQTLLYGGTLMNLKTDQPDIDLSSSQTSRKEEAVVDDDNDRYEQVFISSVCSMHSSEKGELPLPGADDDLSKLPSLSEEIILDAILQRYSRSQIYTYIGDVIIAVNPFTELPLYGKWASRIFRRLDPTVSLPPHIYAVAERALRALLSSQTDQCCVIGGESGAGKTETCKLLVQHLMNSTTSVEHRLNEKLHQANPLLEAFGNAQTTRNHNSSRFAKYMELIFAPTGCVLGGHVHEYLLEKSRVVQQGPGEGNFHIFYWMLNGTTPEEKSQLFLDHNNFNYLRNTVPQEVMADNQQKLLEIKECMKLIGFSQNDLTNMFSTLAAVLHLGDVTFFESDDTGGAMVIDSCILTRVSKLLQVPFEDLVSALTVDVLMARGEELRKTLSVPQACDNRDALAKALYNRLFSWIVNGINQLVAPLEDSPDKKLCFGILDIFGFENLEKNYFEQMCINLANEQMQVFYQQQVFQQEIADCLAEKVPPVEVTFPSGQEVVDVFMQRNTGIFDLLDEESCFPKATDKTLATKLHNNLGKKYNRVYKSPKSGGTSFTIVHYAGTVQYHLAGVLEKNRDTLHNSLTFVMQSSDNMLVKEIFQSTVTRTGSISPSARQRITRKIKPSRSPFEFFRRFHKPKQGPKKMKEVANLKTKKSSTLTFHFQNSLKEMVTKLEVSAPHFVHCIKPNHNLEALMADRKYVSIQLCYGGILQTAIVRKDGYAVRCSFQEFVEKYPALITFQKSKKPRSDYQQQSAVLLSTFSIPISQVGCNKVFLHLHQSRELDAHEAALNVKVVITQSVVRRFLAKHLASKLRKAREVYTQKELSQREIKTAPEETSPEEELTAKEKEEEEESIYGHVFDDDQEILMRRMPRDRLTGVPADVQHSLDFLDDVISEFTSNTRELDLKQDSDDADAEDDAYQDSVSLSLHQTSRKSDSEHREEPCHSMQLTEEFEMNRKHNHNSLHLHQQHQQYYSQDVLHDPPSRAFPPSPREMYSHAAVCNLATPNGHQPAGSGSRRAPPAVPERSPDTHLTSQPHSSRKSSISSRESTSSSDLCNEVNEVFDASPQHSYPHHQHHHQYNPATAANSRFADSRPFSYAAGIDPRVLQQRQQCTNSPVINNRSRVVSEGFTAGDMSYSDTQGRGFQPYGEPESWHNDSGKQGSGDSGSGLNGHAHGAPPASHAGGPSIRATQHAAASGPAYLTPGHCQPPPPPPPSQMYQGQRTSHPPGGAVLPGPVSSTKPLHSHHHIVTKPNPSPPTSRKSSSSSCHSPVHGGSDPPAFQLQPHGRACAPPPPSFPAPPPPLHPERCMMGMPEMRSPSPPLPPPPPEILSSSGVPNTVRSIPLPGGPLIQPIATSQRSQHVSHEQVASVHSTQGSSGMMTQLTQVKLRKPLQPENGVGQPAKEGDDSVSPLGIRLKPTSGKFSNIYQQDEILEEKTVEELPPTQPLEVHHHPEQHQQPPKDEESLILAALSKMDIEIPDDIDITQCPGLVEITKATPNWKREMIEKKNREKIEEYVKQIMKDREQAAKWRNVPEWKRALLLKKDQEELAATEKPVVATETAPKLLKKTAPSAPKADNPPPPMAKPKGDKVPAALNIDPAELESMPPWKRELLFKREKVPVSFFNEFNPDEEDAKNVCGQVPVEHGDSS